MRKKISILLCACMIVTSIGMPLPVKAQGNLGLSQVQMKMSDKDVELLTNITSYVKSKITIPKDLTEFSYLYDSGGYDGLGQYTLMWGNKKGTKSIMVRCDSKNHITQFRDYQSKDDKRYKPVHAKADMKKKADAYIKKVLPEISNKLLPLNSNLADLRSGTYTFEYERMENKIPMPDNNVSVTVNYETGQVVAMNTNWSYSVSIPSGTARISKEDAGKIIGENLTMNLIYRTAYDDNLGSTAKAYLVYQPDKNYLSVDGITGQVYDSKVLWTSEDSPKEELDRGENSGNKEAGAAGGLTDKEIANISKLKNLISKEEAILKVKNQKSLLLDENFKTIDAGLKLYNSGGKEDSYRWELTFSNSSARSESKDGEYEPVARAYVDAKSGMILSFYANMPEQYNDDQQDKWNDIHIKYDKAQCADILESFLKTEIPDYFKNAKLMNSDNDYVITYKNNQPVYGGYNYNYARVNQDILYEDNGFSGSVDGVTGKIYSYYTNWKQDMTFQSKKGVMSPAKAFDHYITKDGYGLSYEITTIKNASTGTKEYKARLVYKADVNPPTISPFTGKQLDYDGKTYIDENGAIGYSDINSSKNKKAILLLADLGIGFRGGKFKPSQKITKGELETLLYNIDYKSSALSTKASGQTLTRLDAVKRLVTLAGMDKAAKLNKIYKTDFKDQNKIKSEDLGYVAIAKGLSIVSGNYFYPSNSVTREEAAQMVMNLLMADY